MEREEAGFLTTKNSNYANGDGRGVEQKLTEVTKEGERDRERTESWRGRFMANGHEKARKFTKSSRTLGPNFGEDNS